MSKINLSPIRRGLREESGQIIMPWVAVLMFSFLGVAGLTMDVGRAYVAHSQLQNAANSAALAAAGYVYSNQTGSDAYSFASGYSASTGGRNLSGVGSVTTTVFAGCSNSLMPAGSSCTSTSAKNAVQVVESTTVRNYIMPIFWGTKTTSVSAAATASMQGAANPWNLAIVLDSTASMGNPPPSGSCAGFSSAYACAQNGIKTLLEHINSCSGVVSCSASTAKFRVALFTFPNVTTATANKYWDCTSGDPTSEPYTLPKAGLSSYTTLSYSGQTTIPASTYEATPVNTGDGDANGFVYDYWSGSTSNSLNASSDLTKEVGGASGCTPMGNPGGQSSYGAASIYAAQDALKAEKALYGGQNALIFLTDGQFQATCDKFPGYKSGGTGTDTVSSTTAGYSTSNNCSNTTKNLTGTASTYGIYPDFHNECQQAITAAQVAQAAGTIVYSVAFQSESTGCTTSGGGTDTSITATATSGQPALTLGTMTPCTVMKNIATPSTSTKSYFYADTAASANGCGDDLHKVSDIQSIFDSIAADFTLPRMLPNSTFAFGVQQTS